MAFPNGLPNWLAELNKEIQQPVVPPGFLLWSKAHGLPTMDIVPQQNFYSLAWTYYKRFGNWPSESMCETLLEKVLEDGTARKI